ncbi:hypothetical protein ACQEVB_16870 [Pseudonocardia sp. CA-107938]|uniref:hypothetical protein n=1 Tax=Pseudonocardia sp. CA-107938 TaxID=3240021 RepID=UPI003D8DFB22
MQVMTRCTIKPGEVERVLELLRAVYEELATVEPDGLRYASFQLDDGVSLVSFVELEHGPQTLQQLPAFQRYRTELAQACVEPPVTAVLQEVGAYRFH